MQVDNIVISTATSSFFKPFKDQENKNQKFLQDITG